MDYLQSISTYNIDDYTAGADTASPLADNSWGAEPMQPYTPTGNGSGVFVDTSMQNAILGGLSKVVDYAIKRDAYTMGMQMPVGAYGATGQQVLAQRKQSNGLFLLLVGLGAYLVLKS